MNYNPSAVICVTPFTGILNLGCKITARLSLLLLLLGSPLLMLGQICDCNEFIYLNEPTSGGKVHKYMVNPDNSLTEIFNSGNTWYPGPNASDLPSPHGLGMDNNGNLYIADGYFSGEIRKLNCDGEITPASEFSVDNGSQTGNIQVVDNILYTNQRNSFDLCQGSPLGDVILEDSGNNDENWGFYVDPATDFFYSSNSEGGANADGEIWRYTAADYGTGTPVAPFLSFADFQAIFGASWGSEDRIRTVVTDMMGNIYVTIWDYNSGSFDETHIVKFDSSGNYISHVTDTVEGDGGFFKGAGMVYSKDNDIVYVVTQSFTEDCLATFDTDLNYLGAAVDATGDTGQGQSGFGTAKAVNIQRECCPTPAGTAMDINICLDAPLGEEIFLQDLTGCDGKLCEGEWAMNPGSSGISYNSCNDAITLSAGACGSFTLSSDGLSDASQCGAFEMTFNFVFGNIVAPSLDARPPTCANNNNPPRINTSGASASGPISYQWQMSTVSCADGFTDIAGATNEFYNPQVLTAETHYRVVVSLEDDCAFGNCSEISECVTLTPVDLTPSCNEIQIVRN